MSKKNVKVSKSVLEGCLEAGVNPVVSLLKIANKPNVSLILKVKIFQSLLPYLYKDREAMDDYNENVNSEGTAHVNNLLKQLTLEDLSLLADSNRSNSLLDKI